MVTMVSPGAPSCPGRRTGGLAGQLFCWQAKTPFTTVFGVVLACHEDGWPATRTGALPCSQFRCHLDRSAAARADARRHGEHRYLASAPTEVNYNHVRHIGHFCHARGDGCGTAQHSKPQ